MTIQILTEQLALAYDELSTINKHLGQVSSALLATRRALEQVSPLRFENAYEKYYSEPETILIRQERERQSHAFAEMAKSLRQSV
jgi:hypothetical protein